MKRRTASSLLRPSSRSSAISTGCLFLACLARGCLVWFPAVLCRSLRRVALRCASLPPDRRSQILMSVTTLLVCCATRYQILAAASASRPTKETTSRGASGAGGGAGAGGGRSLSKTKPIKTNWVLNVGEQISELRVVQCSRSLATGQVDIFAMGACCCFASLALRCLLCVACFVLLACLLVCTCARVFHAGRPSACMRACPPHCAALVPGVTRAGCVPVQASTRCS